MSINSSGSFLKKMLVTIVMSILYGAISVSLDPRYADFITEQDFGDIRPAIFFPAIIAILYGPLVGGLTAALGNLLYDGVTNVYFDNGGLEIDNLVGFIGNFAGGFVVGVFSKAYRHGNDPFSYREAKDEKFRDYFNDVFWRRLIRNTMAAVLGLSLVTGILIGYGLRLDPTFPDDVSFVVFTAIAYWNGIFLLIAIPLIYIALSLLDFWQEKQEKIELEKRRNMDIIVDPSFPFEFPRAGSPKGDELWNLEWGALNLVIKNSDMNAHSYAVRVASNDIFSPHRHTTPNIKPGETDEMYFNIYGITSGEKECTIYVGVDDELKELEVPFVYKMGSSSELIFRKIMGMLLIIAFGVSIALILLNVRKNFVLDTATIVAFAALPVEIILVLLFYLVWNNKRTKQLFRTMGLSHDENEAQPMLMEATTDTEDITILGKINRKRRISSLFLILAAPIFVGIAYIIVTEILGNSIYSGDFVFYSIFALILVLIVSDLFLEQAENLQRQVLDSKQLSEKVIRKAMTSRQPEIYKTTQIHLKMFNPFNTRGIRLFFHSIDNISPKEMVIDDIPPQGIKVVSVDYTSLQEGKRKFSLEVVQLTDENDQIIPIQSSKTFDQEVVELSVSNTKVLGLSEDQISLLRGAVAGVGSLSIAVTFISNLLGYAINQTFLQSTLPLLIILQVPVLWLTLTLQDRIKTSLNYEG